MSVRHLELVLRQIPVSPSDTQQIFLVQRTLHFEPEISELKFLIEEMNRQMDRDILKIDEANRARYTPEPEKELPGMHTLTSEPHPDLTDVILHKREEKKQ